VVQSRRLAVVIPARTCPCRQVVGVLPQLSSKDKLVVFFNAGHHDHKTIRHDLLTWVNADRPCGAGHARNLGVEALSKEGARILLFCDADDYVSPTWVAELARPLLDGSADLTGGALKIGSRKHVLTILPKVDYWYRQALFGSNMGITYKAWCELGGFDESLRYCEDTDLAWRASDLGLKIRVVPSATVNYSLRPTVREFGQRFRWGRSSVQLLQKHSVPSDHLPRLMDLFSDKRSAGFASSSLVATIGQWLGQSVESCIHRQRKADMHKVGTTGTL
jgi:cellulose synthase/poly-beta-1,6-N-acetylglucosamine synthase-like glycosyltransferase